jgi:NADH-quinone oxidoreductase subunit C
VSELVPSPGVGPAAVEHPSIAPLRGQFGDAVLRHEIVAGDEHVVFVDPTAILMILKWLKESPDQRYDFLSDVTAVDYGGGRPIQVVYQLFSLAHRRALRVKAELPVVQLEIDSVVPLWDTANWLEREVYDMFGISFRGHPDPRRILMPEDYAEGHPLRKDFPLRGRFSRAEQTRRALVGAPEDYLPAESGTAGEPRIVPWQEVPAEAQAPPDESDD